MYRSVKLLGLMAIAIGMLCVPSHLPAEDFKYLPAAPAAAVEGPCEFEYLPHSAELAQRIWVLDSSPFRFLADDKAAEPAAEVAKAIEPELALIFAYRDFDSPCEVCSRINRTLEADEERKPGTPRQFPFRLKWKQFPDPKQARNGFPLFVWADAAGNRHEQLGWKGVEAFKAAYSASQRDARKPIANRTR